MPRTTQYSYGGVIRIKHDFPYQFGDTARIGYIAPDLTAGFFDAFSIDETYVKGRIPEDLLVEYGSKWKFNIEFNGTRPSGTFSIQSPVVRTTIYQGVIEFTPDLNN